MNLTLSKVRGQCYDGASAMSRVLLKESRMKNQRQFTPTVMAIQSTLPSVMQQSSQG